MRRIISTTFFLTLTLAPVFGQSDVDLVEVGNRAVYTLAFAKLGLGIAWVAVAGLAVWAKVSALRARRVRHEENALELAMASK